MEHNIAVDHIEVACVDFDRFVGIKVRERQGTVLSTMPYATADQRTKGPHAEIVPPRLGEPSLRVVPGTS